MNIIKINNHVTTILKYLSFILVVTGYKNFPEINGINTVYPSIFVIVGANTLIKWGSRIKNQTFQELMGIIFEFASLSIPYIQFWTRYKFLVVLMVMVVAVNMFIRIVYGTKIHDDLD